MIAEIKARTQYDRGTNTSLYCALIAIVVYVVVQVTAIVVHIVCEM